jgi:hypothetical protein
MVGSVPHLFFVHVRSTEFHRDLIIPARKMGLQVVLVDELPMEF